MYTNVDAGTNVEILNQENGWYLVQYNVSASNLIRRTWVPVEMVN